MTAQEKREQSIRKRSEGAIARIDKERENLCKALDKAGFGSAEHHLLSTAIGNLIEAKSQLGIVVSRIANKNYYDKLKEE